MNVLVWDFRALPRGYYHALRASSCPCEKNSIARSTATRDLELADSLVRRTLEIIDWFQPRCWFIENPSSSVLWKRFKFERMVLTSYCNFDFAYRKNTMIAYGGQGAALVLP